jgi:hypothetical protein
MPSGVQACRQKQLEPQALAAGPTGKLGGSSRSELLASTASLKRCPDTSLFPNCTSTGTGGDFIVFQEYRVLASRRRACHATAARPEANKIHVAGSGTIPGPVPHGLSFFFPPSPSPTQHPVLPSPFFLPGEHNPEGSGGGEIGVQLPPPNGSYKLNGPAAGPSPAAGWFNSAV